jgi:hypothetical protein
MVATRPGQVTILLNFQEQKWWLVASHNVRRSSYRRQRTTKDENFIIHPSSFFSEEDK